MQTIQIRSWEKFSDGFYWIQEYNVTLKKFLTYRNKFPKEFYENTDMYNYLMRKYNSIILYNIKKYDRMKLS